MASIKFDDGNTNSGSQVGINNGVINVQTEQPEPRPSPLSTVPFPPDPDFVSRDQILDQIHEKALISGCKIVLFGLGGVGKTQIVIEYAHQVRRNSPETWVFWVHASNAARCEKSLRDLADRVKIPGRQDRNVDIFQLVGNWLQDETIGKWVLILDNVDDDGLIRNPSSTGQGSQNLETISLSNDITTTQPPLRPLLQSSNGFIIITSRSRRVGLDIAGHRNLIEVRPMEKLEAIDLLQRKLNIPAERGSTEQLVEALELMPLAIIQAAGYITHQPRCSVLQYLEKIQKSDRAAMRLLDYEAGLLSRDWDAKNSILLTWQVSFDYIQNVRPSAAGLLSLMSFFDRQGIQESVLRVQQTQQLNECSDSEIATDSSSEGEEGEDCPSGEDDNNSSGGDEGSSSEFDLEQSFEEDIALLCDYSLISIGESNTVLTMHRLVQLTVRTWLKTHGQLEQWKEKFINNLNHEFPTGDHENWEECRSLLPHVILAVSQQPESNDYLRQWASLLYRGAWYTREIGSFADSREMALRSRKQRVKILGEEDEMTIASTVQLGMAYFLAGQWKKAEELQMQVIKTRATKLSADHPDTLTSMNNLALTYVAQGRWEEAEKIQMQVIKTRATKLSADRPDTPTSMHNLALTYTAQGRWDEAEELQVQAVEMSTTKLGADHPDTLPSMNNLALIYTKQGRLEEAEKIQMQVIRTRATKLSADHPDTLTSMNNLALTYMAQGRWEEAEKIQIQVIKTRATKLSADHPATLTSMNNLASTYTEQGRWDEAEELQVQAVEMSTTKLGADHPNTLTSMNNLALTYAEQGRWEEAEKIQMQVMKTRATKLSADHPDMLSGMNNLALTYAEQGRWEEAEKIQMQFMKTRTTKLSADHPGMLVSMANLAKIWKNTGRHAEAVDLLTTCVAKEQRILGPVHPYTVSDTKTLLEWETGGEN
ncbi:hypothetical protein N7494_001677 [Penicillium frequentans]|uniref:Kinesin light chain n=1 Tax=Penicillium frequentans TaxID=3151616 RepID=A0AAD6D2F4_9EURO|nr:hypothetical protein N7494_001677 [Penicillium glabrum]